MNRKEIAQAFSIGNFQSVFQYLSEKIIWIVVGESKFEGIENVRAQCEKVAGYFGTVTTNFKTLHCVGEENIVIVNGTAEFLRNNKRINYVDACDVYEFDNDGKVVKVTSYCMQLDVS